VGTLPRRQDFVGMLAEDDGSHPQDAGGDRQLRSGGGFSMFEKACAVPDHEPRRLETRACNV